MNGTNPVSEDPKCEDGQYDNCVGPYNEEILTPNLQRAMRFIANFLPLINIPLLVATYKWRWLGRLQIYIVMIYRVCFALIPSGEMRGLHPFLHCVNGVLLFLMHYCESLVSVYLLTFLMYFEMIFAVYIAYDRHLGMADLAMCTIYAFAALAFILSLSAGIEHVSSLYHRMKFMNQENSKLLNGMHEGLLIISKP